MQLINIGTTEDDGTGDLARTAFGKVNANFALTPGLQSETAAYIALRATAGGAVSSYEAIAIDRFIAGGKAAGWWAKITDMGIFAGPDLASALVKLKAGTGAPTSIVVHGSISYDPVLGVYPTSASASNYLDMEYTPSDDGISGADVTLAGGYSSIDLNQYNVGLATVLDTSEDSKLAFNTNGGIGTIIGGIRDTGLCILRGDATDQRLYFGGVKTFSGSAAPSVVIEHSLNMFRWAFSSSMFGGSPTVKMNFYAIGTALTDSQTLAFNDAVEALCAALGRDFYPRPLFVGVGDSTGIDNGFFQEPAQKIGSHGYLNVSVGSTTYTVLGHAQFPSVLHRRPDFVHIQKFTNDLAGVDSATIVGYQAALTADATALRQAGVRVLIGSWIRWSVISDADVDTFNVAASNAARAAGVRFVDLVWGLRDEAARRVFDGDSVDLAAAQTVLSSDGVHPTATGEAAARPLIFAAWNGDHYRRPILDLGSVSSGAHVDEVLAFVGASVGDGFDVTPPSDFDDGLIVRAFCDTVDVVTLRVSNPTAGSINPAQGQFIIHQRR